MPQSPERKREYAAERWRREGGRLRVKQAEWRNKNRGDLKAKNKSRRLSKRAMCLVAAARVRARKKGIPFSLDIEDVNILQDAIDKGRCEISGVGLSLDGPRSATSPSLDRIVPDLGYVCGNVRIVCQALNAGMGDWGEVELLRIVTAWVAKRSGNAIVPQVAAEVIGAFLDAERGMR